MPLAREGESGSKFRIRGRYDDDMPANGLVEWLLRYEASEPRPRPGDGDIITESDGETDSWGRASAKPIGPEDTDVITKNDGEGDKWASAAAGGPRPGPDTDTITRRGAETDRWGVPPSLGPKPPWPDDTDILTFDDREGDVWSTY